MRQLKLAEKLTELWTEYLIGFVEWDSGAGEYVLRPDAIGLGPYYYAARTKLRWIIGQQRAALARELERNSE
jgi:hypothetical protein